MTVQFLAPTPRKKVSKREAARLFLLHNGICSNCGQQIRPGQSWFIEHADALVLGGADDDTNRRPAHTKCKDVRQIARGCLCVKELTPTEAPLTLARIEQAIVADRRARPAASPSTPEGYKLVPVEATFDMKQAGGIARRRADRVQIYEEAVADAIWAAMLASAPSPKENTDG